MHRNISAYLSRMEGLCLNDTRLFYLRSRILLRSTFQSHIEKGMRANTRLLFQTARSLARFHELENPALDNSYLERARSARTKRIKST
jgi:hypothetical protein